MSSLIVSPPGFIDSERGSPRSGTPCIVLMGASTAPWWAEWQARLSEAGGHVEFLSSHSLMERLAHSFAARAVIVVSSPASVLARESLRLAEAGREIVVGDILRAWMNDASQLARVARLSNTRCKFFAEEDLWRQPTEGMERAGIWATGQAWPEIRPDRQDSPFFLSQVMAKERLSHELAAQELHDELLACCEVLNAEGGSESSDPWAAWSNLLVERHTLQTQMDAATLVAAQRARDYQVLLDRLHQSQEELERALTALKSSEAQVDAQRHRAREATDAAALLQQQLSSEVSRLQGELHSMSQTLEGREADFRRERQEALRRIDAVSTERLAALDQIRMMEADKQQLARESAAMAATLVQRESQILGARETEDGLRKELLATSSRLRQCETESVRLSGVVKAQEQREERSISASRLLLERLHSAQELLEQALTEKATLEPLRDEVIRHEREIRNLLGRLHDQQEEVERLANVADASYGPAALVRRSSKPRLQARSTVFVDQHMDGVHRHLTVRLVGALLDGVSIGDVRLRLAEHEGRTGLVVFAQPGEPQLLSAWASSGQEEGVDYMLLVPADVRSKETLSRLGASDWAVVLDVATLFATELPIQADPSWSRVAARLCQSFFDLPLRLRYDRIDVSVANDRPACVSARFHQVSYGHRFHSAVSLTWTAEVDKLALQVEPGDDVLPLAAWPIHPGGEPLREWVLPVGSVMPDTEKRQVWDRLSAADRAWVFALLDALPAVAHAAANASLKAAIRQGITADRAAQLHKEAHQLRRSLALRHRVQRLMTRGQ